MKKFYTRFGLFFTALTLLAASANAQFSVINLNNSGPGSLRDALSKAQNGADISFDSSLVGTIMLASALTIDSAVTITSPSPKVISIDGAGSQTIISITRPVSVSLNNLTFKNGASSDNGGGIYAPGGSTLRLTNCIIRNCTAQLIGGGIYVAAPGGFLLLENSTVTTCNAGSEAGGIYIDAGLGAIINNSTIDNNESGGFGGGMLIDNTSLTMSHVTISGNVAATGQGIFLRTNDAGATPFNTISYCTVAENGSDSAAILIHDTLNNSSTSFDNSIVDNDVNYAEVGFPNVSSGNYNISSDGTMAAVLLQAQDANNLAASLFPLADNGGPTKTHAISPFSWARDLGGGSATVDQRFYTRDGVNDKGAFEYDAVPPDTSIVINEVDANTSGVDEQEFVELYDGGAGYTCLNGLYLVFYSAGTGLYQIYSLGGYVTNRDGYFVLGNSGVPNVDYVIPDNTIQDGADAVALFFNNRPGDFFIGAGPVTANIIDAIVYDNGQADDPGLLNLLNGGEPQINENELGSSDTHSMQRIPNGMGGFRNTSNYANIPPTPGAMNFCPGTDPGTGGSVNICSSETEFNLWGELTGSPDAGGFWTDDDATGGLTDSLFNANGLATATYNFTYHLNGSGTCPNDSSSVSVNVTALPDTGGDTSVVVCETQTNVVLNNELAGTPDPGGSWSDDSSSTQLVGNIFDPSGLAGNIYGFTYTHAAIGGCTQQNSHLLVEVETLPSGGADSNISICNTESALDLYTVGGGAPTPPGTWNDDDLTGQLTGSILDATTLGGSFYDFTYTTTAVACANSQSTLTISVSSAVNPGLDSTLLACSAENALNLTGGLGGSPDGGGFWIDYDATGQLSGSILDCTPLAGSSYDFYYKLVAPAPCGNDSALVTVTVVSIPDPGLDSTVIICETETAHTLFGGLGGNPTSGGTWSDDDATGGLSSGNFDATGQAGSTYDFTYTVSAAGCADSSAVASVTVEEQVSAGSDGSTTVCVNEGVDLSTLIGTHDAGGTWADDDATGSLSGSMFTGIAAAGVYDFTYTVSSNAPCANSSATVTVTVDACANIAETNSMPGFRIAPNPSRGIFSIEILKPIKAGSVFRIMSSNGQVISEYHFKRDVESYKSDVDITEKSDGMYYIQFLTGDKVWVTKIMKN